VAVLGSTSRTDLLFASVVAFPNFSGISARRRVSGEKVYFRELLSVRHGEQRHALVLMHLRKEFLLFNDWLQTNRQIYRSR
jgi:hypothetical protein